MVPVRVEKRIQTGGQPGTQTLDILDDGKGKGRRGTGRKARCVVRTEHGGCG
jgi:hypothetical protein